MIIKKKLKFISEIFYLINPDFIFLHITFLVIFSESKNRNIKINIFITLVTLQLIKLQIPLMGLKVWLKVCINLN